MGSVFLKVEGGDALRRALLKCRDRYLDAMREALPAEAEVLKSAAQALVPVGAGTLRSSAVVSAGEAGSRGSTRAAFAYEDPKAPAVHEGVHWGHFHEDTPGRKWLERAFNSFEPGATDRIVARLRRLVGDGGGK